MRTFRDEVCPGRYRGASPDKGIITALRRPAVCGARLAGYGFGASAPASSSNSRAAHAGQNTATPSGSRVR